MHPTAKSYTKWGKAHIMDELRTKEEAENEKKMHESLNNFFRHAIGQEPYASLTKFPGWPLLSPSKVQMQKCEKCVLEFCSPNNHRRHIRIHRRSRVGDNENFKKERPNIAAFWRKLAPEDAGQIFSLKNFKLENLSGAASVKALASLIKQPGLSTFPQSYIKAGAALLDIVQCKVHVHSMTADELFSILDNASEQTFLCGGTSAAVQRFIYHGDAKHGLDEKNVVSTVAFLLEHKLVKAWMVDKDAEALRFQKELVEEEELIQRRKQRLLERKRQRKLRLKGLKEKETKEITVQLEIKIVEGSSQDFEENSVKSADECDSPAGTASSSVSSASIGKNEEHVESATPQLTDDCDDGSAMDEVNSSRDMKDEFELLREETSQSAQELSFCNELIDGSSIDMDLSQVHEKDAIIENVVDLSTKPNEVVVDVKAGKREQLVSSPAGNHEAEIDNMSEELHSQVQDRQKTAQIQRRPSGGWKGNEYESYSMHFRNYEVDKPYLHRKNGRVTWEGRTSGPFEKTWITRDTVNEDRSRNLSSRQYSRPYRSNTNLIDNIKAEQRLSSDFETASGTRSQQYRQKFLRAKQVPSNAANGHAVWTRKADIPSSVPGVQLNTRDSANVGGSFREVSEDALPPLAGSAAISKCKEDNRLEDQDSTASMPAALDSPQPVASSAYFGHMQDADGRESNRIIENCDRNHESTCLGSLKSDPCSQNQDWCSEEDKSNTLIIGSLCVPLGNAGSSLFQAVSVVLARSSSESLAEVDHEISITDLEAKPNVDGFANPLKLGEDEPVYTDAGINVSECLTGQASVGASLRRSLTGKVWRARGQVMESPGVSSVPSMVDNACNERDSNSYIRGHLAHNESSADDDDKSQGDPIVQVLDENLSSCIEQANLVHLNYENVGGDTSLRTAGEIDEPVVTPTAQQNTSKSSWGYSSNAPSATVSNFLLHRWDAAILEAKDSVYS